MNSDIFYDYLRNIFHPYLIKERVKFPVLLFVDGHSSHLTLKISNLCTELEIILICLYPNSTRLLQPADVAAFKPIKSLWKKSVLECREKNPTLMLTLEKMAPLLETVIDKFSQNRNIIQNGFRACGIYPWDSNVVDYSKCLGIQKTSICKKRPSKTATLSFEIFMKVVGDYLLQQLETFSPQDGSEKRSEEFIVLHRLLQEYNKTSNVHNKDLQLETTLKKHKEKKDEQDTEYINIATAPTIAPTIELEINNSCSYKNKDTINETNNNAKSVQEINFIDIEAVPIVLSDNALIYGIDNSAYVINDVNIKDNSISIDTTNETEINKTYVDDLEMDNNITYENNKTIDETNEILDLSFTHRRNCSTTLYQFLQQLPIPE